MLQFVNKFNGQIQNTQCSRSATPIKLTASREKWWYFQQGIATISQRMVDGLFFLISAVWYLFIQNLNYFKLADVHQIRVDLMNIQKISNISFNFFKMLCKMFAFWFKYLNFCKDSWKKWSNLHENIINRD